MKIAIDAGHGPNTAGKRTPDESMREYQFNSRVAFLLREWLMEYEGVETLFTHEDGRDVPLLERVNKAHNFGAKVFLSIHANAFGGGEWNAASGIETYTTTEKDAPSMILAAEIQSQLIRDTGRINRGVKQANFRVLWGSSSPAELGRKYRAEVPARVLVEYEFMTNKDTAELLKSETYRRKCANATLKALVNVYKLRKKNVNQSLVTFDLNNEIFGEAYLINGSCYVPLRVIGEGMGGTVSWDGVKRHASIRKGVK